MSTPLDRYTVAAALGRVAIDPGIAHAVEVLTLRGIPILEACQGGPHHSFPEPTIRFGGDSFEGPRAWRIAQEHGLAVQSLRRIWVIVDDELSGPLWEIILQPQPSDSPSG